MFIVSKAWKNQLDIKLDGFASLSLMETIFLENLLPVLKDRGQFLFPFTYIFRSLITHQWLARPDMVPTLMGLQSGG